jgi:predicted nucleic acid-binding protein
MAYIDSNVFIYPVLYGADNNEKARNAKEILLKIEEGELKAYTSTLTWDEVVWVVSRVMGRDDGAS